MDHASAPTCGAFKTLFILMTARLWSTAHTVIDRCLWTFNLSALVRHSPHRA